MAGTYKSQTTRAGLDGSAGFLVRADGMPHRTVMPSWEKESQFRAFPAPNEGGGWSPFRLSSEDNDFSLAVWSEPVTRRLGVFEQFTFITRIPGAQGEAPAERFCNALLQMIDEKPREVPEDWIMWPRGSRGQAAKLTKVRNCIFLQGMEIMRQGKMLVDGAGQLAPKYPALLMGSISLQIYFEQLANKRVEGMAVPPASLIEAAKTDENVRRQLDQAFAAAFAIGDWCSLEGGRIMRIFQAPPGDSFQRPHYAIQMGEVLPIQGIEAAVRSYWRPWDQLLRYHTAEEQVQLLCKAFPPEAVDFVFGRTDLEAALPKSVQGAWRTWKSSQGAWAPGIQPGMAQAGASAPVGPPSAQPYGQLPSAGAPAAAAAAAAQPAQPAQPAPPAPAVAPPNVAPSAQGAPTAAAPTVQVGGMQFNLSGGGNVPEEPDAPPVMGSGAFAQTPPAFSAPVGGAPPGAVPAVQPGAAAATGSTPATAAGEVDAAKLNDALNSLQKQRDRAAGGNLGG